MELIGAGFGGEGENAAARAPVLRIIRIRDDLKLLYRLERGDIFHLAAAVDIADAIQQDFVFAGPAAIEGKPGGVGDTLRAHGSPTVAGAGHACNSPDHLEHISSLFRKIM